MIYHLKLQPSEIESLDYYEYWYFVKDLSKVLEEKNKESNKMNEQMNENYASTKSSMQPKMPNIKMPSMSTPKI